MGSPYFASKSEKNLRPSGGYSSGDRVATETCTFLATSAGIPPSFGSAKPDSATPSGPYSFVMPAAWTSLYSWTAPLAVMPEKTKQSAPESATVAAWERKLGALGSIPSLPATSSPISPAALSILRARPAP